MIHVMIPKNRIGALIGPKGKTKKRIENELNAKIKIDSSSGSISIKSEDSLAEMKGADISKAIGRGFSPEKAFKLFSDDYYLHIFDIRDYVGKSQKRVRLIRGRIIGTGGKMRRNIEELTDAYVSIQGNTVAIIGDIGSLQTAKKAVDMILSGSEHSSVNRYLENARKRMEYERFQSLIE